jgi:cell wall-associated NlpC family hydrolase
MIVIACAAGLLAAGGATADPSVASKQAEAQQVLGEIQQIDASMERAVEAWNAATSKLNVIKRNLRFNRIALRVARGNLVRAQGALSDRLVEIYTSSDEASTLGVLLGATSLDDLLNRVETVQSVTQQDTHVIAEVSTFRNEVQRREKRLVRARSAQVHLVAARAAEKVRIQRQLAQRQALLHSIRGQIERLQAQERSRQLAMVSAARARIAAEPPVDTSGTVVGIAAATPAATVAPPSQYGGVVGIAMRYLGAPYRWGGASPSGFDCSGFVMFVYAQVGVSLPHFTGAQWAAGVPVSRDQLQPGDLVFFNGLGHVGIYIGGGQMVHAPHTGDVVKVTDINSGWYAATYVGARRIVG